jgi:hypothetical protein
MSFLESRSIYFYHGFLKTHFSGKLVEASAIHLQRCHGLVQPNVDLGQEQKRVNHLLLFQGGLEHLLRVPEHTQSEVTLSKLNFPIPVLVFGGLQGLRGQLHGLADAVLVVKNVLEQGFGNIWSLGVLANVQSEI